MSDTIAESILIGIFGPKPRGGGGRVGRWNTMRNLARYLIKREDALWSDIIYSWAATQGLTPHKAEELLEHLLMIFKDGKPIVELEGDSPKIIRWVFLKKEKATKDVKEKL